MVAYRQGISRQQHVLYQHYLDEVVGKESLVRVMDAYVESLDMHKLGFQINENTTGAPAYRPQLKLKIYVYGYLNSIRSSRRLERECKRNLELMWLTEGLAPDFKTIANFRKINSSALKEMFRGFLQMCRRLDLLEFNTVAIDGTKMRGQNSGNEVYRRDTIEKVEAEIQRRIDEYLSELDKQDECERTNGISENPQQIEQLTKRLEKQKKRADKIAVIKSMFEADTELNTVFATDGDARYQSDKGKIRAGYNVQTAVDEKHKLIVVSQVTNEQNDKRQLSPMIDHIRDQKAELGIDEKTSVIADAGYFSEAEIINTMGKKDCRPIVSAAAEGENPLKSAAGKGKKVPTAEYENEAFVYEEQRDLYRCPQNQELVRITQMPVVDKNGRATHRYQAKAESCHSCPVRELCTTSKKGRMLLVSANREEIAEYMEQLNTDTNKRLMAKRKELVEHPFGTLKRSFGYTFFLMRGKEKVQAEFNMMCFAYNLKRVFNIMGFDELMSAIQ